MKETNDIQSEPRFPSNPPPTHTPAHISCFSALPDMLPLMLISKYQLRKLHRLCHVGKHFGLPLESQGNQTETMLN